ncbi:hypothetical protein KUTeg_002260 [Tegillarca granosa]|uniref:KY-like immunoglobulin-like domain-containing protein n=1 Tax=Tegillarca granosa TaxID=220873 RepID=A0ABQ9FTT7_TEGGR|nr:hypothetical protein KUTeg_002260 [Tegillarca granosa]
MKQPIQKLVTFLTKDLEETLPKVRILFRWVTAQSLDQLSIQQNEPAHDSVQYQFWRIKNLKGNYAQLFSLLCSYAHIPCIIISGRLKGSSYSIGESVEDAKHYGEWNAVLIDGSWRLLNVFWGTCTEGPSDDNSEKKLVYCCDNNYFLTDPDQFIYTHFPDEDRWQLRDRPISQEEFTNQALLKDRFFDMNLKLNGPHECVVYHEKEVSFSFEMSEETQSNFWFLALLSSYDDGPRNDLKRYFEI